MEYDSDAECKHKQSCCYRQILLYVFVGFEKIGYAQTCVDDKSAETGPERNRIGKKQLGNYNA